mgnify:CR=1 FL=1
MTEQVANASQNAFRIVGIGASAGGLEALEKVVSNLSKNSNLALVIVQHLAPDTESLLAEILQRANSPARWAHSVRAIFHYRQSTQYWRI